MTTHVDTCVQRTSVRLCSVCGTRVPAHEPAVRELSRGWYAHARCLDALLRWLDDIDTRMEQFA